jgi:hypothetical protein
MCVQTQSSMTNSAEPTTRLCAMRNECMIFYYKLKKSKTRPKVEDNIKMSFMDRYVVWDYIAQDRDQ